MRVIAGAAKGRKLFTPKSHNIRPALDKVKGAIFNILFDVTGTKVLDLFAGTGAVGIEALSRGAVSATFVDNSNEGMGLVKRNLDHCRFTELAETLKVDVDLAITILQRNQKKFDLIFVDPPYLKDLVNQTLKRISESGILEDNGKIIVEHHPKEPIGEISGLTLTDTRKYGQTLISFLCRAK